MSQIHIVIRRVSPALKIDLVQVGRFKDGQFDPLPLGAIADTPFVRFFENSDISEALYIDHSEIANLVAACEDFSGFSIEFFDNTIVLIFNFNLNYDEVTTEEEGKGN